MVSLGTETAKKKAMWLYPKVLGFHPPQRWGHSACFSQGNVYIFGGCCGGMHFRDVLVLNLDTMAWSALATTGQGPGPRDSHTAILVGRRMIVFGGTNGSKKVNDIHILDLCTKEWIQPECKGEPPSPRESHTATLVSDERMVIFGGSGEGDANYLNDLHILDLRAMSWTSPEVKSKLPVPRDSHSTIAIGNKLYVYGGDGGDQYHGNVDMLDMDTMTWSRLDLRGSSPSVRAGHAAVNIGTKIYVIGGVGDKLYYNDVWILDVITCSWTHLDICGQQPQGRFSHTAIVAEPGILIYGGCGVDEHPLNELLVLQLGVTHPDGHYNISPCRTFGISWNQEKKRFLQRDRESNLKTVVIGKNAGILRKRSYGLETDKRQGLLLDSDTSQQKKRSGISWVREADSEQEEHSLSLSQHSSPSQSDQEQTAVWEPHSCVVGFPQGIRLFKQMGQIPSHCQLDNISSCEHRVLNGSAQRSHQDIHFVDHQNYPEQEQVMHVRPGRRGLQFPAMEHKSSETETIQNLIGSEVRGTVDGTFDSGFLMTATVNGRIFRGVLFAPGPGVGSKRAILEQNSCLASQAAIGLPFPNLSHHVETLRPTKQPEACSATELMCPVRSQQAQVSLPFPIIKGTTPPSFAREHKPRSDLQGVVLTLGGPTSAGS